MKSVVSRKTFAKPIQKTGDPWIDKLVEDFRSPARVVLAAVALVGFTWFVVSVVVP